MRRDAPESSSKPAKQNRNPSTGGKAKRAPVPRSNRYQPYLKNALLAVEPSEGLKPSWLLIFASQLWKYFAIALKPIKQSDSAPTSSKPRNDALSAQVNSIRQELQLLASNRLVTIITSNRSGGRKAGVIIVIVVLDYGYVWWKGWKLLDFMFATKRGLKDACNSVSNELTKVFHSVEVTKKTISSTLNESSCKYDEIIASTSSDKDKDVTKDGVAKLLLCTLDADNRLNDLIQGLQPNRSLIFASDELWKHLPYQDSVEAQDEVAERMEMKHGLSKALGPLVAKPSLLPIDRFLMFASDGLWEHLTNRDQKSCNF